MVGTNPSRLPARRVAREASRISSIVVQIFKEEWPIWRQPALPLESSEGRGLVAVSRASRRWYPLDGNVRSLEYPANNPFIAANRDAVFL